MISLAKEESIKSRVLGHIVPALVIGAFAVAVVFDRRPVIDPATLAGIAIPPVVREAGSLTIEWTAYRYRECATTIAREIVDSANVVHRLDQQGGPFSATLGTDTWRMSVTVPPSAAWGPARYRSTISYHCGFTHDWTPFTIQSPEIPFTIVPLPQKKIEELRG